MAKADTWFTEPISNPCSWEAVKDAWDTNRWTPANDAYIAAKSPKAGKKYDTWKAENDAWQDISNAAKYRNYFEVNFISYVVAKAWDKLSDVDNQYFPASADRDGEITTGQPVCPESHNESAS